MVVCGYADFVLHTHVLDCFDTDGILVCPIPERTAHLHEDACYAVPELLNTELVEEAPEEPGLETAEPAETTEPAVLSEPEEQLAESGEAMEPALSCGVQEYSLHIHEEACRGEDGSLICGAVELVEHVHSEMCFAEVETGTEPVQVCQLEEHQHDDVLCYTAPNAAADPKPAYVCGILSHTHDSECAGSDGSMLCGLTEHVHGDICVQTRVESAALLCDCGMEESLEYHADACARKTYCRDLADVSTADELYAQWQTMPEDVQIFVCTWLSWTDRFKLEALEALIWPAAEPVEKETMAGETKVQVSGAIPENAQLSAELLELPQTYTEQTNVPELVFAMDITVYNGNGTQWQPAEGETAAVSLDAASLGLSEGDSITLFHEHNSGEVEELGEYRVSGGQISFETTGFSVFYGYTVDFVYEGLEYSIHGGTGIYLSDLFSILGIERSVEDVTDVVFSDESLVDVEYKQREDDALAAYDWHLQSLQAFSTEETLAVTFEDGTQIVINVYDAVTISGTQQWSGDKLNAYTVSGTATIQLTGNVNLGGTITIPSGAVLNVQILAGEGEIDPTRTILRKFGANEAMFKVESGGTLNLTGTNPSSRIIVDGNDSATEYNGAAVLCDSGTLHISYVTITNNRGSGVHVVGNNVNVTIDRCTISYCTSESGSAIVLPGSGYGPVTVTNTVIEHNFANEKEGTEKTETYELCGGTIRTNGSGRWTLWIEDCIFRYNRSNGHGGGVYWNASGSSDGHSAKLTIKDCQFLENWALNFGGAIFNEGQADILATEGTMTPAMYSGDVPEAGIVGTLVQGNSAGDANAADSDYHELNNRGLGGGICIKTYNSGYKAGASVNYVETTLGDNVVVRDNTARHGGGIAMWIRDEKDVEVQSGFRYILDLDGSKISNNTARENGGGLFFWSEATTFDTELDLTTGSITWNKAANGGGVYVENGDIIFDLLQITDNTASQNGGGLYLMQTDNKDEKGTTHFDGGSILRNEAQNLGGGIYQTGVQGVLNISNSGVIDSNKAKNGGGVYLENGTMEISGGFISNNKALIRSDAYAKTTAAESATNEGVGGGLYLNQGSAAITADGTAGMYGNEADFAGDEIYKASTGALLTIPPVSNMDLTNSSELIRGTISGWYEDYPNGDTSYSAGLNSGGYANGSSDIVRYRQATNEQKEHTTVTSISGTYTCLTLGYEIDYVAMNIQKVVNSTAVAASKKFDFHISYNHELEGQTTADIQLGHEETYTLKDMVNTTPVTITEASDGYHVTVQLLENGEDVTAEKATVADGTVTFELAPNMTVIFTNTPDNELPKTGGAGTHLYTMGGLLLIAAAGGFLLYYHKKRRTVVSTSF